MSTNQTRGKSVREGLQHYLADMFETRFQPAEYGPLGSVCPTDESELRRILELASEEDIALVPAGAGSSPYGGAATQAGLLVVFDRMIGVLAVDSKQQTITAQPG